MGEEASGEATDPGFVPGLDVEPIGASRREIIKTGRVRTLVEAIEPAVNKVTVATEARSGFVFGSTISLEGDHPSAEIVVKVPADSFDRLMADLSKIGEVQAQESTSEDVTAEIVDLESRLTSARASVERVRGFLEAATNVDELTTVEAELTRRESDVEALEGRLAVMKDQTTLSTITASLHTDPEVTPEEDDEEKSGFAKGWETGRDTFAGAARRVAESVGFALPFVPVAAAMIGLGWVLVRRRRRSNGGSMVGAEA